MFPDIMDICWVPLKVSCAEIRSLYLQICSPSLSHLSSLLYQFTFNFLRTEKPPQNFDRSELERDQQRLLLTPPSRAASRATLASLGSFSLNPIASPALREPSDVAAKPVRGVASVLDGFDPSFLSQVTNKFCSFRI